MSRWFMSSLLLFFVSVTVTIYVIVYRETLLLDLVPIHWGVTGKPDGWVPRDSIIGSIVIMPAIVVFFLFISRVIPYLSPTNYQVETFRPAFEYIIFLVVALMVYLHIIILLAQMQKISDIGRWMMAGMHVIFAAMGQVMSQVRRNFFVGIRTPWTMASEKVWNATHRMAGWTFVVGGVMGLLVLFTPLNPLWSLPVLLGMAFVPVFYSLWLYKRLESCGQLEPPQT
ncbi:MAG: SdpI family protein [Planctomycetia bacterium]|nr:SdpI family protein [Planctomycetia bacterium]